MIRNYVKSALRNLVKHKGYSFINITGLALGIACCLLIILYVKDELTFDRFHKNGENIYRMQSSLTMNNNKQVFNAINLPAGPTLYEELPEIISQTRFVTSVLEIRVEEREFNEGGAYYAEPQFLEIFNFPEREGAGVSTLESTTQVALTKETAERYFGDTDAFGASLEIKINDQWRTFTVGAILRNVPGNSSLDFNILVPFQVYLDANQRQSNNATDWQRIELGFQTFIVAEETVPKDTLLSHINEVRARRMNGPMGEMMQYEIQPLHDMHFDPSITNGTGMREASNKVYSILLSGIAFVILILACINFTNLSVARALPRAKEIGVRKVAGAYRSQLVTQFLSEALFVSIVAFVLGLIVAQLILPSFEQLTEKEFSVAIIDDPLYVLIAFVVVLLAAFIAGIYPALLISKMNTVNALKGKAGSVGGRGIVQKILVVFQFMIAAFLIIGTLTMNQQISYLISRDKGYDDTNLIGIRVPNPDEDFDEQSTTMSEGERMLRLMKNELAGDPNVESITGKGAGFSMTMMLSMDEETGERTQVRTFQERADEDFISTMGIEVLEGRDWDMSLGESERNKILVNETFVKKMDWGDSVLGRNFGRDQVVIGLVKDYNFRSLENEIDPIVINMNMGQPIGEILIKFKDGTLTQSLASAERAWRKFNEFAPFNHFLLEERNADAYGEQERWRSILVTASFIGIGISCLGLFGLAYLSTQRRTKEIGVRKVLGASVPTIVVLLSRNFSILVLVAFMIAAPISWYAAEEWLSTFPYRTELGPGLYLIAASITLVVSWLTVSWHSVKTAIANPVKALRYE